MMELGIFELLKGKIAPEGIEFKDDKFSPFIKVSPANIQKVAQFLFEQPELDFKSLMCLSGVDNKDNFVVVYHLFSMKHGHKITLKIETPKDCPSVPTVENIWQGANWLEREVFDLFGINFEGHSNLVRIMMPDDWVGHPLRKDYQYPSTYNGNPV